MANYKIISDRLNTFFTNNNISIGTSIPTTGTYSRGDIIVNVGPTSSIEPMWICNEGGTPGVWGLVGVGGNGGSGELVCMNETVTVDGPVNEVSLGDLAGLVTDKDKLTVHFNSTHLMQGVDFEISADKTKIVKLTEGSWNESGIAGSMFAFELLKNVETIENGNIILESKLTSITNSVNVGANVSEVEIGVDGLNKDDDTLLVFKNGVMMVEGVDYNISEDNTKIVSIGEVWNKDGLDDYCIAFVVFKEVMLYDGENGSVTMDALGSDVKEVLNNLTETTLQHSEILANLDDTYATKDDIANIEPVDISGKQDITDNNLVTTDKTIVGAINELFQNANNGKQLIADAIGNELITVNSTFSAMSEAILGLRRESENETDAREVLYNMMIEDGYDEATSSMTVDELIELLDESNIEIGDVKQIACGELHTFILKNDGSVWSCGYNYNGQLGLGDTADRNVFTQVTTNINNDVKQIVCGSHHTFILKNDGTVYSCGNNEYGELGLNDTTNKTVFTQVTTNINNDVKQIACGSQHAFILKNDGSVWACGYNKYGQLGLGDIINKYTFNQITTNINNDVKQIACGYDFTFILKNDGSVYSCGRNNYGQLGLGTSIEYYTSFNQATTNINNDAAQIACGFYHTFILKNDGSIWSCGYNAYGQLGLENINTYYTFTQVTTNINNDVKQIACGMLHTFILKNDGSIYSCGYNNKGQLGIGNTTTYNTFTKVTTNINNDVSQIACGYDYTFILKNYGSVYSCGYNYKGQLGLGDTTDTNTFTQVPLSSQSIDEYEINRQKLYYYLLDNEIPVTEDMDIGTMLDLLVDDYINNMILGYENNLRIILTDEGVSVSDEDDMDSLITKVDEEFENKNNEIENSMGLDIITANELPSTGNDGQICVISDSNISNYSFTTTNDVETDVLTFKLNNGDEFNYNCQVNGIGYKLNISSLVLNDAGLDSYYYLNNQWNTLTTASYILMKNGVFVSDTFATNTTFLYTSGSGIYSSGGTGGFVTRSYWKNQINFSLYSKIVFKAYATITGTYNGTIACCSTANTVHDTSSDISGESGFIAYEKLSVSALQPTEITVDISSWTGTSYLIIQLPQLGSGNKLYITDVELRV